MLRTSRVNMRGTLLSELAKECLGPRSGIYEDIERDPKGEYITGILSPRESSAIDDPEVESEVVGESQEYDEDDADEGVVAADFIQPALDPKTLPHSMGISFIVESPSAPVFKLCLTWARYSEEKD